MKNKFLICTTGFALFSMFFGSGNLVFPIEVGRQTGEYFPFAALGIVLTGVIVPLLGVLGMMLHGGAIKSFFSSFGTVGTFIFSFAALALMGPFGVLARCVTVAHGAVGTVFPAIPLVGTSFFFCFLIYLMTLKKNTVIPALGNFLTPLLLTALVAIAFFSLGDSFTPSAVSLPDASPGVGAWGAFKTGFFRGYQTMDLLAAFFFSVFVIKHLRSTGSDSDSGRLKVFLQSSALGGGLLAVVYILLVSLGSKYSILLAGLPPQEMMGVITNQVLGSMSVPVLSLLVVLACFTTAVVLASLFSDFLRKEICRQRIDPRLSMFLTLAIGFFVSILGFVRISAFLGPLLEIVYPSLIVLTLVNIASGLWGIKNSHWPVTLTFLARLCLAI